MQALRACMLVLLLKSKILIKIVTLWVTMVTRRVTIKGFALAWFSMFSMRSQKAHTACAAVGLQSSAKRLIKRKALA